jgi:1,4-dihydroxy-2-naphthoate octaprenyltransferase
MKKWIQAMRLRTLPLAASCILGGAAAAQVQGNFSVFILVLILSTTFLLQILSNLANDYGDFSHGVDNDNRVGPARTLQSGAITGVQMKRALIITSLLAFACGNYLLWTVFSPKSQFAEALGMLVLGIAAIASAIKYTVGNNPYGYRGLGDLFVFLFFGPVGVLGTYFLLVGQLETHALWLACTTGFYSTAVLNLNNLRDHENDRASGKNTLVVKMGFQNGKKYQTLLIGFGTLTLFVWLLLQANPIEFLSCIPAFAQCLLLVKVWKCSVPAQLDSELKKVAMLSFLTTVLLCLL